jgi:hypothetical protein
MVPSREPAAQVPLGSGLESIGRQSIQYSSAKRLAHADGSGAARNAQQVSLPHTFHFAERHRDDLAFAESDHFDGN